MERIIQLVKQVDSDPNHNYWMAITDGVSVEDNFIVTTNNNNDRVIDVDPDSFYKYEWLHGVPHYGDLKIKNNVS